jgi:hypothetical protein
MNILKRGRYIISALSVLCVIQVSAQITFNKTYDFSAGDEGALSMVLVDDGYVLIGNGWGYEAGGYFDEKLKYMKTDFEGNVIWQRVYGKDSVSYYNWFMCGTQTMDSNIAFAGNIYVDGESDVILMKFNPENGDTIFLKQYPSENFQVGFQAREFSDGKLLILAEDLDEEGPFIIKTDEDGNYLWDKNIMAPVVKLPPQYSIYPKTIHFIY